MLGFLHSIFNLLLGIFDTIDNFGSLALHYVVQFVYSVNYIATTITSFSSFIPVPLQILGSCFVSVAIARLCISLGGH